LELDYDLLNITMNVAFSIHSKACQNHSVGRCGARVRWPFPLNLEQQPKITTYNDDYVKIKERSAFLYILGTCQNVAVRYGPHPTAALPQGNPSRFLRADLAGFAGFAKNLENVRIADYITRCIRICRQPSSTCLSAAASLSSSQHDKRTRVGRSSQ
jgi:hypothetical protein